MLCQHEEEDADHSSCTLFVQTDAKVRADEQCPEATAGTVTSGNALPSPWYCHVPAYTTVHMCQHVADLMRCAETCWRGRGTAPYTRAVRQWPNHSCSCTEHLCQECVECSVGCSMPVSVGSWAYLTKPVYNLERFSLQSTCKGSNAALTAVCIKSAA